MVSQRERIKMTHSTLKLYRQPATVWANLPYKEALELRIELARKAMDYYRIRTNEEGYIASEKAMNFNRELLLEIATEESH